MDVVHAAASILASESVAPLSVGDDSFPDRGILEQLLATAFEASLLQDENRNLTFRLALCSPNDISDGDGPPAGLYRLRFSSLRAFTATELRRLTPAVDYDRSLIGVSMSETRELQIWGIIQSGPGWSERFRGGRARAANLPECLILGIRAPGNLIVAWGANPLCHLEGGVVQTKRLNVFNSKWLPEMFVSVRKELLGVHSRAQITHKLLTPDIDPEFPRLLAQQMLQRLISTVQRSRHGGTLLIVPDEFVQENNQANEVVRLKYRFAEEEPRARLRDLIVRVMDMLASSVATHQRDNVGWDDYVHSTSRDLSDLDDAIFEMSHFVATLTAVDGAVVVARDFELLGFGGEISGNLPEVPMVAHALDLEGREYLDESTEDVGTRHRSVYRLCNTLREVMGIVISQDGGARFIRRNGSRVMYWDHSTIIPL